MCEMLVSRMRATSMLTSGDETHMSQMATAVLAQDLHTLHPHRNVLNALCSQTAFQAVTHRGLGVPCQSQAFNRRSCK